MHPFSRIAKRLTVFLAMALFLPCLAFAFPQAKSAPQAKPGPGKLPPVLDRELFFGNPEIGGAQLSPDGKYIAFLKPWKETRNVWVKKTGEPYSAARLMTADPKRPIPGFFWSRDGKFILFVQDRDGDENFNVYAVNPAEPAETGKDAPPARNLTDAKGARAMIYELPKHDPDIFYVGLNDRDAAWHDLYRVKISTGERTLLRKNTDQIASWVFDLQGNLRLATRTTADGSTEILRVDPDRFTKVYDCNCFESCDLIQFHKDGKRVYMATNKGERDLAELVLFDPATGKEELVEKDPLNRVDFGGPMFSRVSDELVGTVYEDDKTRIYFRDKALEADYQLVKSKLPGSEINLSSSTADESLFLIAANSDKDPGTCYLFDRKTKKLSLEYVSREKLPREYMAEMKPIRYKSSDGLEIPAYLTLPVGVPAKNLPLLVTPHGGPWARDGWGFDNNTQFLANRGYAVLQMNFRSSTGYGKKFLNAGNNQWGDLMQDDITWGVKHLVEQGIADPKRVGIVGGSYGGYAALAGVAFTPDLYAAAVSVVGPSNLLTLLETIPPYWEAGRVIFHKRMGDPTTPEGRKQLERQSPLFSASKIKTPLMVVQGANDPRVKKAESEQIVIALRDRKFPVEYLCAPDEGHGFRRPVNNMAMFVAMEKFFAQQLGGRYQDGGTPEVMKRLAEITVDPATLTLTRKADAATVGVPKTVSDLSVGTFSYAGNIALGAQSMPVSVKRVVKEDGGYWAVSETIKLPQGEFVDSSRLEKRSLVLRNRVFSQGPVSVDLTFQNGQISGTLTMNGTAKPVSVNAGGELFADGPGSENVIACLPLAEGFATTFRNFDVQKQKISLMQAKVLGAEEVKVAAGSLPAWKVELSSAEGEPGSLTLWIAKDTRQVVKTSAVLAQMGGAVLSLELQP